MKKNFFKFLLLGALTLSVGAGFVGCKDYDDDITRIDDRLDEIAEDLADLKTKIGAGGSVTDVALESGKLVVKYVDGTSKSITLPSSATAPYVVLNEDKTYTLFIADKEGAAQEVIIPTKASEAIKATTKIDILGVVKGSQAKATTTLSMANVHTGDMKVPYAWVSKFELDSDAGATGGAGNLEDVASDYVWQGKTTVNKGVVLNTLGEVALDSGLLVQITPANTDMSTLSFTLRDSKDVALPVAVGTPVKVVALLTKAAAASAMYYLPLSYDPATTYASQSKVDSDYLKPYGNDNSFFSLVESTNAFRSNYMPWSVADKEVDSTIEVAVNGLKGGGSTVSYTTGDPAEKINVQTDYSLTFNASALDADANNGAVLDYYIEGKDVAVNNYFGLEVNKANGTFKLTKMPDVLTYAEIELNVYKLSVTGAIYYETIKVQPIRQSLAYTVDLGNYDIVDKVPSTATDSLSADIVVDLEKMFSQMDADLKDRWQSSNAGIRATTVTLTNIGIAGVTGNLLNAFQGQASASGNVDRKTTYTILNGSGADASGAVNTAKKIVITPVYAYSGLNQGATPPATFAPNKLTTFTFTFKDNASNTINTLKVTVTPQVPALSDMIKRQDGFWTGNVLNAYYKEPTTWAATDVLGSAANDVYDNATGYIFGPVNGAGFQNLGGVSTTDQKWIATPTFAFDTNAKYNPGNVAASDLARITKDTVFVFDQLPAPGPAANAANGYGQELAVKVSGGAYLGVYNYTSADYAAQAFKIKVMSALYEGRIAEAAGTISVPAGPSGAVLKLTDAHLSGYNYNNQPYSLFKIIDPAELAAETAVAADTLYTYTYIKKVTFSVPSSEAGKYTIVYGGVEYGPGSEVYAVAPTVSATGNPQTTEASYVAIKAGQPSQTVTTKIHVTVTDRFGKVREADVPFTITKAE